MVSTEVTVPLPNSTNNLWCLSEETAYTVPYNDQGSCSDIQMISDTADFCSLKVLNSGLLQTTSADKDAVNWLMTERLQQQLMRHGY